MLFRYFAIVAVIGTVTGCSEGLEGETTIGLPGSPYWLSTASPKTITAHYKPVCISYGFKDGTTDMARCLQTEITNAKVIAERRMATAATLSASYRPRKFTCRTFGSTTTCS